MGETNTAEGLAQLLLEMESHKVEPTLSTHTALHVAWLRLREPVKAVAALQAGRAAGCYTSAAQLTAAAAAAMRELLRGGRRKEARHCWTGGETMSPVVVMALRYLELLRQLDKFPPLSSNGTAQQAQPVGASGSSDVSGLDHGDADRGGGGGGGGNADPCTELLYACCDWGGAADIQAILHEIPATLDGVGCMRLLRRAVSISEPEVRSATHTLSCCLVCYGTTEVGRRDLSHTPWP